MTKLDNFFGKEQEEKFDKWAREKCLKIGVFLKSGVMVLVIYPILLILMFLALLYFEGLERRSFLGRLFKFAFFAYLSFAGYSLMKWSKSGKKKYLFALIFMWTVLFIVGGFLLFFGVMSLVFSITDKIYEDWTRFIFLLPLAALLIFLGVFSIRKAILSILEYGHL
ncbi:hypothetical protein SAMN02745116_00630 [Pilibacter termitis]|uniref:Uncharacterized protein n=1 Tax=Pilibacter termitis TaxID=263852 RepID=A0A1T4LDN4_9ENTE|nr:hypothetical protein [Pilibacter termitis]SJZ52678.1 hypothetical protein SAMN02745116_00630 [Pilibacter termitis]